MRVALVCLALLAACGDDSPPSDDVAMVELFWAAEPAATQIGLCRNANDVGFDTVARLWEESWDGDGSTDDEAIVAVLRDKC